MMEMIELVNLQLERNLEFVFICVPTDNHWEMVAGVFLWFFAKVDADDLWL